MSSAGKMSFGLGSVISMCLAFMAALLLVSLTSAQQPQQPSPTSPPAVAGSPFLQRLIPPHGSGGQGQGQGRAVTLALRCPRENETVPYWIDRTCRAYLACLQHNLTLEFCPQGTIYSHTNRSCVPRDQVNCSSQNEEFSTLVHNFLQSRFFQNRAPSPLPLATLVDSRGADTAHASANGGDGGANSNAVNRQLEREGGRGGGAGADEEGNLINLDDLPSIIVDTSNSLNVTLDQATCRRVGGHLNDLQTSMNMALLMLTGCPQQPCDVTLFRVLC